MSNSLEHDHLRILLDGEARQQIEQPSQHYKSGQVIKGTASYSPSSEVKIDSMTIVFKATLYSERKDNGQASYGCVRTQNQNLFRHEKLIFQGPHKLSPKVHEWHFEFELPAMIKVPFASSPQPIPPTWDVLQIARVVYSLRLCVNPNRKNRSMAIERPISVWPFSQTELPTPNPITQQLMDPTQKTTWKTALTRRRSSAVSVNTQNFNLSISMPHSLGVWQNFSIHLIGNGTSDSEFALNTVELALRAQVTCSTTADSDRAINTEAPQHKDILHICRLKLLGQGLRIPLDNTPVTIKRDMRLIDMTRRDASMLVPNFGISYFRLNYVMDVFVQMVDTKTGVVVERKGELPFEILPGGLVEEGRGEDAPPAFHEVASPPGYGDGDVWEGMATSPAYTVTA